MMPLYNDRQHFNTGAGGYFLIRFMIIIPHTQREHEGYIWTILEI